MMGFNSSSRLWAAFISLLLFLGDVAAFYLPGVAPTSYRSGEKVPLHVNRLTPGRGDGDGKIRTALTYDYYDPPFHFCRPKTQPAYLSESLGSIIFGDRIKTSPFILRMKYDESCQLIAGCSERIFEPVDAKFVNKRIWQNFKVNWLVDGLPAGQRFTDASTDVDFYQPGFQLGSMNEDDLPIFNNHYDILVEYHKAGKDKFRVVGVEVKPSSNRNTKDNGDIVGGCEHPEPLHLNENKKTTTFFTYSVRWQPSETSFATRWDKYLHVYNPKIHWFSLVNSAVIVVFLSSMVFVVLVRALRKDITRYNRLDNYALNDMSHTNGSSHDPDADLQEDSGWKLVHGDVFRAPKQPLVLSIMVGNGAQLFMMAGFTIAFALFGFLSPSNRGSLGSAMILLYTLFGSVGGFASTYVYRCLGGEERWKRNIILTPIALPATVFGTFFLLNLFLWFKRSSGAVPFTTMLIIVLIWFVISVPLSLLGSWLAFRRRIIKPPTRTNQIPRQIPDAHTSASGFSGFLQRPIPSLLLTGILPFGAMFVEIHFIMTSLWSTQVYYMFGFLFICYGLMILTCATVTILNIYFILCAEDYRWQWRSFLTSGACAFYVFVNCLLFWGNRLDLGVGVSGVLYLGYSALISLLIFILTGTIGFVASWIFVLRIYSSIKVD